MDGMSIKGRGRSLRMAGVAGPNGSKASREGAMYSGLELLEEANMLHGSNITAQWWLATDELGAVKVGETAVAWCKA